jgi:hypothetical protein
VLREPKSPISARRGYINLQRSLIELSTGRFAGASPSRQWVIDISVARRPQELDFLPMGAYAIDQDGEIVSGPYRGRNECAISIAQFPDGAPALWSRP